MIWQKLHMNSTETKSNLQSIWLVWQIKLRGREMIPPPLWPHRTHYDRLQTVAWDWHATKPPPVAKADL